jgi:hypothetical protein
MRIRELKICYRNVYKGASKLPRYFPSCNTELVTCPIILHMWSYTTDNLYVLNVVCLDCPFMILLFILVQPRTFATTNQTCRRSTQQNEQGRVYRPLRYEYKHPLFRLCFLVIHCMGGSLKVCSFFGKKWEIPYPDLILTPAQVCFE